MTTFLAVHASWFRSKKYRASKQKTFNHFAVWRLEIPYNVLNEKYFASIVSRLFPIIDLEPNVKYLNSYSTISNKWIKKKAILRFKVISVISIHSNNQKQPLRSDPPTCARIWTVSSPSSSLVASWSCTLQNQDNPQVFCFFYAGDPWAK